MAGGGEAITASAGRYGSLMQYKGYIGSIEYDDEAGIFHGEVINLRDVITFQGESVQELRRALQDSVEDYLEFCTQKDEQPERPFSGRLLVRIDPELHRQLFIIAKNKDISLNKLINEAVEKIIA
jgi:predicted HicB family RNase H-like nuclease